MEFKKLLLGTLYLTGLVHSSPIMQEQRPFHIMEKGMNIGELQQERPVTLKKKGGPSVGAAPLDINNEIGGTLELISNLVGTVGGSASGLVMGLTGISITDCAGSLKGEDLNTLSCEEFLDTISECDSLQNIKPLLQEAKKKYRKRPNKKASCFKNKSRKHGGR